MKISLIVGVSENNVIGNNNKLPWHIKSELKHFRETTTGNSLIMGRKTFDSIGKALPNRLSIVISRTVYKDKPDERILYSQTIDEAIQKAKANEELYPIAYIIGGAQIYKQCLENGTCDELLISRIPIEVEGDTFFPHIPASYKKQGEKDKGEFVVETYTKK